MDNSSVTLKDHQQMKKTPWRGFVSSGLKGETQSLIIAAQDKTRTAHYHQWSIMKQPPDSKCRLCCKAEHIQHFVAGCTTLAPSEDTNRHNKVAGYIHWTVGKRVGLQVTDRFQERTRIPERDLNINGTAVYGTYGLYQHTDLIQHCRIKREDLHADRYGLTR